MDWVGLFKMTNWTTKKLDDCLEKLLDYRGKSPTKSPTGIPVLSAKVVKSTGLLRPIEQTIAPSYYSKWMVRGLPKIGDVVMTTEAPLGEVLQLNAETANFALGQRIVCMRGKRDLLDSTFLRYALISPQQQANLAASATGTTVLGISQKALRKIDISFPKLSQQIAIGQLLSTIDDKIELNRQMNETLEGMARALFRDWFVDFGPTRRKAAGETDPVKILGGAISSPEKATHIANLFSNQLGEEGWPVGWKQGRLDDWANSVTHTVKPDEIDQETHYIGLEHMPRRSIALGQWETAAKVTSNKSAFKRGQVLFGKLRPYFHKVGIAPLNGICSTDIVVVDGLVPELRAFVVTLMSTDDFVSYTNQSSSGTKMPRTSWKLMREYPIARASKEIVLAFSELVQPMHDKILHSLGENQTLADMRDLLLPKLMSGEIRLKEAANG